MTFKDFYKKKSLWSKDNTYTASTNEQQDSGRIGTSAPSMSSYIAPLWVNIVIIQSQWTRAWLTSLKLPRQFTEMVITFTINTHKPHAKCILFFKMLASHSCAHRFELGRHSAAKSRKPNHSDLRLYSSWNKKSKGKQSWATVNCLRELSRMQFLSVFYLSLPHRVALSSRLQYCWYNRGYVSFRRHLSYIQTRKRAKGKNTIVRKITISSFKQLPFSANFLNYFPFLSSSHRN